MHRDRRHAAMLHVGRDLPVDATVAWDLLVDTSQWPRWGPSVTEVDLPGGRLAAGATGRVRTALGPWLPFEIREYTEGRSWSWRVAGVPATSHTVEPRPGGCRVTFGVPILAAPYLAVCRVALQRIASMVLEP